MDGMDFPQGFFSDTRRAFRQMGVLHEAFIVSGSRYPLPEFSVALGRLLRMSPDPDLSLTTLSRFVEASFSRASFFNDLLVYPVIAEVFGRLAGSSQYLSDILVREPGLFHWLTASDALTTPARGDDLRIEAGRLAITFAAPERRLEALKRLHSLSVDVKVLTGDNEIITAYICKEVGMSVEHILLGSQIEAMSDPELADLVGGCEAVASCLGHRLTWRGVFGHPRQLVTQAVRRLCLAVRANRPESPVRFVLMNTAGNANRDLAERISPAERCVTSLIRRVLPPHADNEGAAEVLRTTDEASLEWVVVRPDTLTNDLAVTEYEVYPSPTRSAIFNPGKTSRINVAHFMADLITDDGVWGRWRGQISLSVSPS